MERAIARLERGSLRPRELAEGVVECLRRQRGVQPGERLAHALGEHDLRVVAAFRGQLAGRDVGSVLGCPAEALEPGESGLFDGRLREQSTYHGATCRTPDEVTRYFRPVIRDKCTAKPSPNLLGHVPLKP